MLRPVRRRRQHRTRPTRGGMTHVLHPRGSRPVFWPGCVYAWLCTSATVEGLARGRACWAAGQIGNRPTPVNGCPQEDPPTVTTGGYGSSRPGRGGRRRMRQLRPRVARRRAGLMVPGRPVSSGKERRVARLAEGAGRWCGLADRDVTVLRRAALVHDIGRVGVPTTVDGTGGGLGVQEHERERLHPYLTERVLAQCAPLEPYTPGGRNPSRTDRRERIPPGAARPPAQHLLPAARRSRHAGSARDRPPGPYRTGPGHH
jgi:hypothetical protein